MINIVDLHWAAGFLDGEGSFQALERNGNATVVSDQKYRPSLEKLQRIFGGYIYIRRRKPGSAFPGSQDYFIWQVAGRRAIEVMMTLYVLMSPYRKGQIEKAIQRWKDNAVRVAQRKMQRETKNVQRQQRPLDAIGLC